MLPKLFFAVCDYRWPRCFVLSTRASPSSSGWPGSEFLKHPFPCLTIFASIRRAGGLHRSLRYLEKNRRGALSEF